jgi:hypothetical protein
MYKSTTHNKRPHDVREEDISHERGDQNETLLLQAYIYADIFSIRYYHFPCMYV